MIISDLINFLNLKRKKVRYGKNLKIAGFLGIHGKKNRITIGNNVRLISNQNINTTSGFNQTHLKVENDGIIIIGDNVGISSACITSCSYGGIQIDDNVLIGSGVKIWDSDFHSSNYDERMKNINIKSLPIHIKEGAFIGSCAIILKGVTIGIHSIVGAGSVVTKSIPDNEIWGGNPARFIKRL